MARLGKRERAEKRARIARISRVDYSYSIKSSLLTEKPMAQSLRHYKDCANGLITQKSLG
jgi:hypothetical protein